MNNLNGTTASRDVDLWSGEGGTTNLLPVIDWSQWHEFWITVKADTSGGGTHHLEMFVDGAFAPVRFELTAGTGNEGGATAAMNYIGMGFSNSPQMGAVDLDFLAVKAGIFTPVPEPGCGALLVSAAWLLSRRRRGGASSQPVILRHEEPLTFAGGGGAAQAGVFAPLRLRPRKKSEVLRASE